MTFKKLEMYGFKSFADKTAIEFNNGMTAIVGPNGCGKSNIADSVRWVLGEQSAKQLRGSNMKDVIFKGTEKRKEMSFCEVSLYFDNSDNELPTEYKEVVVSRKLYRDGQSEYLINKKIVRLKDVVAIMHDIGLGKEGYSIIGQGKIDEVLSAKPDDRRFIFEEAAGVAKFKQDKNESERALLRTEDKLSRLNDIIYEMERNLTPLEEQAKTAKKYFELRDKARYYDLNNYIYQYEHIAQDKAVIDNKIKAYNEELDAKNKAVAAIDKKYEQLLNKNSEIDFEIKNLHEKEIALSIGLEQKKSERNLIEQEIKHLSDRKVELLTELEQNKVAQTIISTNIENEKLSLEKLKSENFSTGETLEKVSDEFFKLVEKLSEEENDVKTNQSSIYNALEELSEIKSNATKLDTQKATLIDNINTMQSEVVALNGQFALNNEELSSYYEKRTELYKEKDNYIKKLENYKKSAIELKNLNNLNEDSINEIKEKAIVLKNNLSTLIQYKNDNTNLYRPVQLLLNDMKIDASLAKKADGLFARLIKTEEKYNTAIEAALGATLQNIVCKNEDDISYLIKYLKSKKYGRITFLPLNAIEPKELSPEYQNINMNGVINIASNLVTCDSKYSNLIKSFLGRTYIVDNIDNAIAIAKKYNYAFKICTLEGDVILPQRAITGGSEKQDNKHLLGLDENIEKLTASLEECKSDLKNLLQNKENFTNKFDELEKLIRENDELFNNNKIEIATLNQKIEYCENIKNTLQEQITVCNSKIEDYSSTLSQIDKEFAEALKKQEQISNASTETNRSMQSKMEEGENLKERRNELFSEISNLKEALAELKIKIDVAENNIIDFNKQFENNESKIALLNTNIKEFDSKINANKLLLERLNTNNNKPIPQEIEELKQQVISLEKSKREAQEELSTINNEKNIINEDIQIVYSKINNENVKSTRLDENLQTMQEKIELEYEMDYNSALPFKDENYDYSNGFKEGEKIRKSIQSLGNINATAIEQFSELKERYDDVILQRNDVVKAKEDIQTVIDALREKITNQFLTAFNHINANFSVIFTELFGGGRARMELEEGDPLECGINIIAEPPGKKLQSIMLLSGGEKALTAIAILFSILTLRPMPFCILDEIEAALDDANATRFAKYLHKYKNKTQFIVITHRKPTMEYADSLYGITMQEKGVSRTVSVKFNEAKEYSEEAK